MGKRPDEELPRRTVAWALGAQAAVFAGIGAAIWHLSGRPLRAFIDLDAAGWIGGTAFGIALIAVAAAIFRLFPRILEKTTRLQERTAKLIGARRDWPLFVWISICAGIGEEALFRGGLVPVLSDHIGTPGAVAVTALAFALFHMAKPPIAALLFVIGVVFGGVYVATGSLLTVIVAHVLYDIWAIDALRREAVRLGMVGPRPDAG